MIMIMVSALARESLTDGECVFMYAVRAASTLTSLIRSSITEREQ
jgi:hypothetical protein